MRALSLPAAALALASTTFAASAQNKPTLTVEEAVAIALKAQPGEVAEAELDQFDGRAVVDIEIINDAGDEVEFKVDLETGEILNVWMDDDPTDDPLAATLEDTVILIPGHVGGGWDTAARAIGDVLMASGAAADLAFENRDGGNGGVGLNYMINNSDKLSNTLLMNTAQFVIRSLNGTYTDTYADLVPVAAPIGDFAAFVVHPESDLRTMQDLIDANRSGEAVLSIGGGSAERGIDHVIAAMAIDAAGRPPVFEYAQFGAPEPAFAALAGGQVTALITDYTRALALSEQGVLRILGVTSPDDFALPSGVSNLRDQGVDFDFVTWTGFFAAPGTSPQEVARYDQAFATLYQSATWEKAVVENGWIARKASTEMFVNQLKEQHDKVSAILAELDGE